MSAFLSADTAISVLGAVAGLGAAYGALRATVGSYKRDVAENRKRLHQELRISASGAGVDLMVPSQAPPSKAPTGAKASSAFATASAEDVADAEGAAAADGRSEAGAAPAQGAGYNTVYNIHNHIDHGVAEDRRAERDEQTFTLLLADYYAHGLTQAQRSSVVSLVFSGFGCVLLFVGVGLAIWKTETTGDLYATMVTNVTGIVTGVVGVLFHRQARRALEHLEGQTRLLRQDMRTERETRQAIRLVDEVADPSLKARLQAALVLQFTEATLPAVQVEVVPGPRSGAASS